MLSGLCSQGGRVEFPHSFNTYFRRTGRVPGTVVGVVHGRNQSLTLKQYTCNISVGNGNEHNGGEYRVRGEGRLEKAGSGSRKWGEIESLLGNPQDE